MVQYALNDSQIIITTLKHYESMDGLRVDSDNSKPVEERTILLPVSPSDLMFDESSDSQTLKLMNYGEIPISINRKLAKWSISSFFPKRSNKAYYNKNKANSIWKYPFDLSSGTEDPYTFYCATLLEWKNKQIPLVFMFNTWGNYYYCQITNFKYGRKDGIGNVYYDLQFQEYKKINLESGENGKTDYSSNVYYPESGESIQDMAKKIYGSSEYYKTIMSLNNLTTPVIIAGKGYKIR